MRIFVSYSTPDRAQAESISLALEALGHDVFFDREDLKGGEDYNSVIYARIAEADMLIFLISPASVRDGAYTMTEVRFAREKWSHPGKHVLPVLIEATPLEAVPAYLKSVTIFEPEGNVAAEVVARVSRQKPVLPVRYMVMVAALAVVAAIVGIKLWGRQDGAGWEQRIEADEFLSRYVYPEEVIERTEFTMEPGFVTDVASDSVVRLTRIAYGSISDTAAAMSITLRFRNLSAEPLKMDFTHRFFSLDDDQGRKAELLYFCCPSGAELLAANGEREMQLIFAANPGWSGKEIQAHRINFHVTGMVPLTSGTWSVPALATAAAATERGGRADLAMRIP